MEYIGNVRDIQCDIELLAAVQLLLDDDRGRLLDNGDCGRIFIEQNQTMVVSHHRMGYVVSKFFG